MRIRRAGHRPGPAGSIGGVAPPGERAGQLRLHRTDNEAEHGVKRGQPVVRRS